MLLATNGAGNEQVKAYLEGAYGEKGGATMNLISRIKRGKLKPMHINLFAKNNQK